MIKETWLPSLYLAVDAALIQIFWLLGGTPQYLSLIDPKGF
jgi:hypothetical protein